MNFVLMLPNYTVSGWPLFNTFYNNSLINIILILFVFLILLYPLHYAN